eukprot:TRINITY_DN888_c2_g2_i2.p1 TRINITY_DN888_c2_g2~~TRINITY_DN888_c2_g2_i2.p1  ORF type:complete len:105 (+),score=1.98 TRINITY_DN888_c2_g2_i2:89-403(+)
MWLAVSIGQQNVCHGTESKVNLEEVPRLTPTISKVNPESPKNDFQLISAQKLWESFTQTKAVLRAHPLSYTKPIQPPLNALIMSLMKILIYMLNLPFTTYDLYQ